MFTRVWVRGIVGAIHNIFQEPNIFERYLRQRGFYYELTADTSNFAIYEQLPRVDFFKTSNTYTHTNAPTHMCTQIYAHMWRLHTLGEKCKVNICTTFNVLVLRVHEGPMLDGEGGEESVRHKNWQRLQVATIALTYFSMSVGVYE